MFHISLVGVEKGEGGMDGGEGRGAEVEGWGGGQEAEDWRGHYTGSVEVNGVGAVRETELPPEIPGAAKKPADGQLKINRPLFRQMRDDRDSLIYCTNQLEYSSHQP